MNLYLPKTQVVLHIQQNLTSFFPVAALLLHAGQYDTGSRLIYGEIQALSPAVIIRGIFRPILRINGDCVDPFPLKIFPADAIGILLPAVWPGLFCYLKILIFP